jgi:hypothetical protein
VRVAGRDLAEAIRTPDQLVIGSPAVPGYRKALAKAYLSRGELLAASTPTDQAGQDLNESRKLLEDLVRQYPDVPEYRGLLGRTCSALGRHAALASNAPAAEEWFQRGDRVFQATQKPDPDNVLHPQAANELQRARKPAKP